MTAIFTIIIITLLISVGGSIVTQGGLEWYETLFLPSWNPPGAAFGIAWTIIFICAALSATLAWQAIPSRAGARLLVMYVFALNAVLNVLWSVLFFQLHRIDLAFFDAVALEATVILLILRLSPHSRLSAILLLPYLVWVAFATVLNGVLWWMNI